MKTFTKERWEVYKASFISTPKRYPVEMALALLIFLIHCTKIVKDINCCEFWLYCAIVVAYIFNSLSEYKWCKIVYYLMPLAAISIWFIDIRAIVLNSEFIIFFILCLVLLFITPKCRDNNDFSYGSLRLFFYSGVSIAIGGLILLAAYAIFFSVEMIFQIDTYSWRSEIAYLVYPFLMLWCFFTLYKLKTYSGAKIANKILNIICNYIITPALIIYAAILYIYGAKIVFTWTLPEGNVTYLVFSFTCITLINKAIQPLLLKANFNWFYRNFIYIAIGPLLLFWVGFTYRIGQYGLTTSRIYLLIIAAWLTLALILMQTKRYNNYRFILLFGVVVVAIFTYIPGISANDISIYSQRAQLIELATENGTFNNEGKLIALENNDAQKQFESSFEYLSSNNDTTWLFENIGYATLKDITNSTSLKSTLNKPSGYKYFETTKQTINTNGYSKIILRPNANRNDNHSSFNIQVPNESAMLINQETLDEIYHKTTEHSNSNPDIEELHFIQNDTIIYIKRIDYKEGTITDLDIEALLIP